jgi:hypothetical protein
MRYLQFKDDAMITEQFSLDRSENNSLFTRLAERSGPLSVRPYPEVLNPVITKEDANIREGFMPDGFWAAVDGTLYILAERLELFGGDDTEKDIVAFSCDGSDLENWTFEGAVLTESEVGTGLSYPWFRKVDGTWYLTSLNQDDAQYFWTTDDASFPDGWSLSDTITALLVPTLSPCICRGRTAGTTSARALFCTPTKGATSLGGRGRHTTGTRPYPRPGCRPIVYDDGYIGLWYQDGDANYGDKTRGYRISELTPDTYEATEMATSPIIEGSGRWVLERRGNAPYRPDGR